MQPVSTPRRSLSFDSDVQGRAQPWVVHHRGLEFHGEVIVAETIDPVWRMPLEGDVAFRVAFCTVPQRLGSARIQDPSTAMAVLGCAPDQARHALTRELRSTHETRALSHTGRDAETLAQPSNDQLDKFVGLVQVADPSVLANVLDDSVVEFLRGFLCRSEPPRR